MLVGVQWVSLLLEGLFITFFSGQKGSDGFELPPGTSHRFQAAACCWQVDDLLTIDNCKVLLGEKEPLLSALSLPPGPALIGLLGSHGASFRGCLTPLGGVPPQVSSAGAHWPGQNDMGEHVPYAHASKPVQCPLPRPATPQHSIRALSLPLSTEPSQLPLIRS